MESPGPQETPVSTVTQSNQGRKEEQDPEEPPEKKVSQLQSCPASVAKGLGLLVISLSVHMRVC